MRAVMLLGPAAAAVAWVGGSHALACAAAALLYLPSILGRGGRSARVAACLAAPVVMFSLSSLEGLLDVRAVAALVAAALAWAPLFVELGGRVPVAVWTVPVVLGLTAVALVGPWSLPLVASDIAQRAQVLVLAAASLLVVAVDPRTQ